MTDVMHDRYQLDDNHVVDVETDPNAGVCVMLLIHWEPGDMWPGDEESVEVFCDKDPLDLRLKIIRSLLQVGATCLGSRVIKGRT